MALSDLGRDVAAALERRSDGLLSAYVFGSHASGRAHRDSDLDVAVLLDRDRFVTAIDRFEERVRLTTQLQAALRFGAVDVVVLNDAPPQLARAVLLDGHRVFCADAQRDHAFRRVTLSRAADLVPFLRRVRRVKLDAIAR
jgi:predicted nucleotidyltransferase